MQPLWFEGAESSLAHWDDAPWHLALFLENAFFEVWGPSPAISKVCSVFQRVVFFGKVMYLHSCWFGAGFGAISPKAVILNQG